MSEKKYEVEYNKYTDKYEITEVDTTPIFYEPNTNPTAREKLHDKLVNMGRSGKIFLTFFFNLYGSLFRFSSNTAGGFIIGLADLVLGKILAPFFPFGIYEIITGKANSWNTIDWCALAIAFIPFFLWFVDIISIFKKGTIVFIGDKKYKNYSDYKKTHK